GAAFDPDAVFFAGAVVFAVAALADATFDAGVAFADATFDAGEAFAEAALADAALPDTTLDAGAALVAGAFFEDPDVQAVALVPVPRVAVVVPRVAVVVPRVAVVVLLPPVPVDAAVAFRVGAALAGTAFVVGRLVRAFGAGATVLRVLFDADTAPVRDAPFRA